jgi:diguanylate cyclase (GGDEF)-like protein/PAS domain S-box-containing protein
MHRARRGSAKAIEMWRLLRGLCAVLVLAAALIAGLAPAHAELKAIDIGDDQERLDIRSLGELHERGDSVMIKSVPEKGGLTQTWSADASVPGTKPAWFAFALRNTTDKQVERWLVVDRYNPAVSGVLMPVLDASRVEKIAHQKGYAPVRIDSDRADIFRIILEPGSTVTFVAELWSEQVADFFLWTPIKYEQRGRDRQLFNGVMVGIAGVLALFLTAVFAANHKAIFPSAAVFAWCVLAYLCVDFGFWQKLFSVKPAENAQYRAATEAAMAASLLVFLHVFLRLRASHGFVRLALGVWIAAQCVLVALAFLDPRLAATLVRLSSLGIAAAGAGAILFLALGGQDRALSLVPSWMLLLVWLFGIGATLTGRLSGDFVVYSLTAGLVLIVVLIGFTVTQFAFRSNEPAYGTRPGEQQLRALAVDGAGAAVWEWNARRDEIKVSPVVEATLGLKAGELSSTKADNFIAHMHPADRERFKLLLWSIRERAGGELRIEFRMRHVDNSYRWFELEAASLPNADRRNLRCVGLVREATDTKLAQERLLHNAVHDSLTGLPNRELFLDRLTTASKRATLEPLVRPSLLFIDIDRFRTASTATDGVVGDSLLLTIARRLQRSLGPQDTLARIGHDQFALLLLNQTDPRELAMLAEHVRRSVRSSIAIGGQEVVLTASIGIAIYDGPDENPAELLHEAEIAMYRAKRSGSDRVEIFNPEMRSDPGGRVALEEELRGAIDRKQLRVVYQPIFYLPTETLAGFEAQLRWEHPRLGTLNPAHFVPVAEESDLVLKLGSYVLTRAAREAQRWQRELPRPDQPVFVSVNVSSRQLFRPDLVNEVRHILGRAVMPKGSLRLEISESQVMENPERALSVLEQLAAAGAGLALDEFATGYSSLSYLGQLPFDAVKVDGVFVQGRGQNGSGGAMLRSIVALAKELGRKVIAEGVEAEDDIAFLRSIGCEYAQGVYYGELMSERDVLQLLKVVRRAERRLKRSRLFRQRASRPEAPTAAVAPPPPGVPGAPSAPPLQIAAGSNGAHPPPALLARPAPPGQLAPPLQPAPPRRQPAPPAQAVALSAPKPPPAEIVPPPTSAPPPRRAWTGPRPLPPPLPWKAPAGPEGGGTRPRKPAGPRPPPADPAEAKALLMPPPPPPPPAAGSPPPPARASAASDAASAVASSRPPGPAPLPPPPPTLRRAGHKEGAVPKVVEAALPSPPKPPPHPPAAPPRAGAALAPADPPGPLAPPAPRPAKPAPKPRLAPLPTRIGRPGPDLSKLPPAIRESLAKLAGDQAVEEEAAPLPAPPQPPDTTTRER